MVAKGQGNAEHTHLVSLDEVTGVNGGDPVNLGPHVLCGGTAYTTHELTGQRDIAPHRRPTC